VHSAESGSKGKSAVLLSERPAASRPRVIAAHNGGLQLNIERLQNVPVDRSNGRRARDVVLVRHARRAKEAAPVTHEQKDRALFGLVHDDADDARHKENITASAHRSSDARLARTRQRPQGHGQTTLQQVISHVAHLKAACLRLANSPWTVLDVSNGRPSTPRAENVDEPGAHREDVVRARPRHERLVGVKLNTHNDSRPAVHSSNVAPLLLVQVRVERPAPLTGLIVVIDLRQLVFELVARGGAAAERPVLAKVHGLCARERVEARREDVAVKVGVDLLANFDGHLHPAEARELARLPLASCREERMRRVKGSTEIGHGCATRSGSPLHVHNDVSKPHVVAL